MRIPLPDVLRDRLHLIDPPPPTRDAATIAVVRDGPNGLEAFLMRRQTTMEFAAGMYVFPGGSVQAGDSLPVPWIGPGAPWWAERLGCSEDLAHALVVSAIRETFEETGVLLAGPNEHEVIADTSRFSAERVALDTEELTFAEFLATEKLVLRADLIGPWAHWITPAFEPKRFDTRFFVAALPPGQQIVSVSDEADRSGWSPLTKVLSDVDDGRVAMLPPTAVTCRELSPLGTDSLLESARARTIRPIEPKIVRADGEYWLEMENMEHL